MLTIAMGAHSLEWTSMRSASIYGVFFRNTPLDYAVLAKADPSAPNVQFVFRAPEGRWRNSLTARGVLNLLCSGGAFGEEASQELLGVFSGRPFRLRLRLGENFAGRALTASPHKARDAKMPGYSSNSDCSRL